MSWLHLIFVLLNFSTLGRLYARINAQFPGTVSQLWEEQSFDHKADIVLVPTVFAGRAMLLNYAVMRPYKLPVFLLGDDKIATLVQRLNDKKSAEVYRFVCKATGWD